MNPYNQVKVSIIVPFYNASKWIERCLLSALNQTMSDLEILAVDDGSTDNSLDLVRQMMQRDCRIKIFSSPHLGCGGARNVALPYVKGKFLYFLDADDYMCSKLLEKMIGGMENANAPIAFCRFQNVNDRGDALATPYEKNLMKFAADVRDVRYLLTPKSFKDDNETQSVLWSLFRVVFLSDIVKQNKLTFSNVPFAEDFLFLADYLKFCQKGCLVDEYLYLYTKQTDGSSNHSRGFHPDFNEVFLAVLNKAKKMLEMNTLYTDPQKEVIYKTFALLIAHNMILNVFCSSDYEREYKKSKETILALYSMRDLEQYHGPFSEIQRITLEMMQKSSMIELYEFLTAHNIIK